jgi:ABC-type multidrug transport system permease subunit
MNTSFGAVIASKQRRKIIKAFKKAGAVSVDSAKSLQDIGLANSVMINIQKRNGVIIETRPDTYYLNEVREKELNRFRLYIIAGILIIAAFFLVIFYAN